MPGTALNFCTAAQGAMCRFLARAPLASPWAAAAGCIAATLVSPAWWVLSATAVACPLALGFRKTAFCALLVALCCLLHLSRDMQRTRLAEETWLNPPGCAASVTGTIARTFRTTALLKDEATGRFIELAGPLLPPVHVGERWQMEGFTEEFRQPVFPGEFDRKSWLEGLGCVCRLGVAAGRRAGMGEWPYRILGWAEGFRDSLARNMSRGIDPDSAEYRVLVSLVLGEKNRADSETLDTFRKSGCLHAFAVSGLHIGLLALLFGGALRLLRCPPRLRDTALLAVLGFYLFITGFPVSAVRAYAMIAIWLGSRLLRRPCTAVNTWCATALLILLADPPQLLQAGFQLSFAIYAVIVAGSFALANSPGWWATDPLLPKRLLTPRERLRNRMGATVRGLAAISLLAWLASLPIAAYHFSAISLYGFAANMMIAPILPLAMGAGLACAAVSGLPALVPWFSRAACMAAGLLLHTAEVPASWPGSYLAATPAAPADAIALFAWNENSTACMLGNPGVLIHDGSDNDARYLLAPSLFQANYTPAALILLRPGAAKTGGAASLRRAYPGLRTLCLETPPLGSRELLTPAGRFTIFPPAIPLHRRVADDYAPVVLWENAGRRLLYAGNASLATLKRLPPACRRADCLIIGSHRYNPALDSEWIASTGARSVYLLPEASNHTPAPTIDGVRLIRLKARSYTSLRLSEQQPLPPTTSAPAAQTAVFGEPKPSRTALGKNASAAHEQMRSWQITSFTSTGCFVILFFYESSLIRKPI